MAVLYVSRPRVLRLARRVSSRAVFVVASGFALPTPGLRGGFADGVSTHRCSQGVCFENDIREKK